MAKQKVTYIQDKGASATSFLHKNHSNKDFTLELGYHTARGAYLCLLALFFDSLALFLNLLALFFDLLAL